MTEIGSSGKKRKLPNAGEKQKETPKVNKQPQLFGPMEEGVNFNKFSIISGGYKSEIANVRLVVFVIIIVIVL
jgi:hypothetical protein